MIKISKTHESYKRIKDILNTNKYPNLTIVDDIQIFKIILNKNLTIDTLLYCFENEYFEETKEILDKLILNSKNVYEISLQTYKSLALKENHIGIIAALELPLYEWDDFKNKDFLFILDRLEIPGNIGTIYRTLDSINANGVILVDAISKLHNPKVTASSRGCTLTIPTISSTFDTTLKWLIDNHYTIYLGEPTLGLDYQSYEYKGKIAIIVGNERFGIQKEWYNHPHKKVFIPMEGSQNSLNVGVAASILAYEAYMKRK